MKRQKVSWIVLSVLVLLMFVPVQVYAAYEFYVTIEGTKQGKFKGESTREGLQNKIPGVGFQYEVKSPRDVATGQASGKRQHGALVIIKEWGAASPQLFQALVTNEVLKSVQIEFVRTDQSGREYVFQTIRLTNATVSNFKKYISVAECGTSTAKMQPAYATKLEDISITFQRIDFTDVNGKTAAADDWTK